MVVVDVGVGRGERVGGDHGEVVILVSNKFVGGWGNEDRGVYSLIFLEFRGHIQIMVTP